MNCNFSFGRKYNALGWMKRCSHVFLSSAFKLEILSYPLRFGGNGGKEIVFFFDINSHIFKRGENVHLGKDKM